MDFACVGEWFLGSILFLYLLFPLLRWGLRKQPLLTWVVVLAASLPVHYMGWDARLVAIHIPEFLLGMAFVHWKRPARLGVLAGCAVLLFTPAAADGKVACALFSAAAFILLAALGGLHPLGAAAKCVCAPQQVFLCGLSDPPCHHSAPGG